MKIEVTRTNTPLLDLLVEACPDSSKTTLRSWVKLGRIQVNGWTIYKPSQLIGKGSTIELLPKPQPRSGPLTILFEDAHITVIEKPAGLLSVDLDKQRRSSSAMSAHRWLKERYPGEKIYVIHRLDRETSGVMIFARSEKAFTILKEDLKQRLVKRIYLAVVEGRLEGEGAWESYLVENKNSYKVFVSHRESELGREFAKTLWKNLSSSNRYSLLECNLETGKKNQIRVQAEAAGHPIAGDRKYGATSSMDDVYGGRICLHAWKLTFTHPTTKKSMTFEVPAPAFFKRLMTIV